MTNLSARTVMPSVLRREWHQLYPMVTPAHSTASGLISVLLDATDKLFSNTQGFKPIIDVLKVIDEMTKVSLNIRV